MTFKIGHLIELLNIKKSAQALFGLSILLRVIMKNTIPTNRSKSITDKIFKINSSIFP